MKYLTFMAKFANMRTFDKANEGTPGGDDATKAAEEAATAAAAKAASDEAAIAAAKVAQDAKDIEDAQAAADAAAAAAAKSDDPKLKTDADEKAALLREVMDKKDKLKTTTKDLAAATKALEAYEGVDPVKVKELLRKEAEAEARDAEARGDFERVKAMMVTEHEKALKTASDALEAERAGRQADLNLIDELTIGNAFGNSEFIRENMNISPVKARQLYGQQFERLNGVVVAYDKPAGSKDRTLLVNAKGEALSFEEALSRIVDADPDKKGLTKSKAKPGASSATDLHKGKVDAPKVTGRARIAANLAGLE